MVTNSVFITTVIALAAMAASSMGLVVKVLGDRIDDLGGQLGGCIGAVESRMNSLEGAVRDVGERLTVLETDFGKR
jgi:hypothetical protein